MKLGMYTVAASPLVSENENEPSKAEVVVEFFPLDSISTIGTPPKGQLFPSTLSGSNITDPNIVTVVLSVNVAAADARCWMDKIWKGCENT